MRVGMKRVAMNIGAEINLIVRAMKYTRHDD
jgi:hypothetical protein